MKRLLIASVLIGLFAVSAMAGDISTSGSPSPVPDGTTQATPSTSPGEMPLVDPVSLSDATLSAVLAALSLLS